MITLDTGDFKPLNKKKNEKDTMEKKLEVNAGCGAGTKGGGGFAPGNTCAVGKGKPSSGGKVKIGKTGYTMTPGQKTKAGVRQLESEIKRLDSELSKNPTKERADQLKAQKAHTEDLLKGKASAKASKAGGGKASSSPALRKVPVSELVPGDTIMTSYGRDTVLKKNKMSGHVVTSLGRTLRNDGEVDKIVDSPPTKSSTKKKQVVSEPKKVTSALGAKANVLTDLKKEGIVVKKDQVSSENQPGAQRTWVNLEPEHRAKAIKSLEAQGWKKVKDEHNLDDPTWTHKDIRGSDVKLQGSGTLLFTKYKGDYQRTGIDTLIDKNDY